MVAYLKNLIICWVPKWIITFYKTVSEWESNPTCFWVLLIATDFMGALCHLEVIQLLKWTHLKNFENSSFWMILLGTIQKIWESLFLLWRILTVFFNSSSIFCPSCERSKLALHNSTKTFIFCVFKYFLKCSVHRFSQKSVLNCIRVLEKEQ